MLLPLLPALCRLELHLLALTYLLAFDQPKTAQHLSLLRIRSGFQPAAVPFVIPWYDSSFWKPRALSLERFQAAGSHTHALLRRIAADPDFGPYGVLPVSAARHHACAPAELLFQCAYFHCIRCSARLLAPLCTLPALHTFVLFDQEMPLTAIRKRHAL